MKSLITLLTLVLISSVPAVANRIEAGVGAGTTHPFQGDTFKQQASSGDTQVYWLGYGWSNNKGIELGLDNLDFDKVDTTHQIYSLSAVWRFAMDSFIHPVAKAGLGYAQSKLANDDKTNSIAAKLAGGLEADFKYVSAGGLVNYHYVNKAGDADILKNVQAFSPILFLSIHNAVEFEKQSVSEAAPAVVDVKPDAIAKKDSDGDGINDDEDKCPNTAMGSVVNAYGCAETETASVKLNIEFMTAKATFDPAYNSEIQSLASFMGKYPDTKVEIAGYTDNQGTKERNRSLSQKRADSVKTALVKAGVAPVRLVAKGYGAEKPIADNSTAEGRKQNRRVMADISVKTEKKK